jgi:streptogramin lyase
MSVTWKWAVLALPIIFAAASGGLPQASAQIATGTVMASTGTGKVSKYDPTGTLLGQLDTATGAAFTTGSIFDSVGNFYVTDFGNNAVTKFDPTGTLIGSFGSGYNASPESVILDAVGNVYVGQADGTHNVLKFNSGGTLLTTFSPAIENRGTDWIELGADQCTLYYTSEGNRVLRYNICTNTQLADFNAVALPGAAAFAHRIRPNGEMLGFRPERGWN